MGSTMNHDIKKRYTEKQQNIQMIKMLWLVEFISLFLVLKR